jgi:hypothetical protein
VTTQARSQCDTCARYRPAINNPTGKGPPTCEAFPDGIPMLVFRNGVDHRGPVPGDHGLRWLSDGGEEFPEWAFPSTVDLVSTDPDPAESARQRQAMDYPVVITRP